MFLMKCIKTHKLKWILGHLHQFSCYSSLKLQVWNLKYIIMVGFIEMLTMQRCRECCILHSVWMFINDVRTYVSNGQKTFERIRKTFECLNCVMLLFLWCITTWELVYSTSLFALEQLEKKQHTHTNFKEK